MSHYAPPPSPFYQPYSYSFSPFPLPFPEVETPLPDWVAARSNEWSDRRDEDHNHAGPSNSRSHDNDAPNDFHYVPEHPQPHSYSQQDEQIDPSLMHPDELPPVSSDDIMRALGMAVSIAASEQQGGGAPPWDQHRDAEVEAPALGHVDDIGDGATLDMIEQDEGLDKLNKQVDPPPEVDIPSDMILYGIPIHPITSFLSTLTSPLILDELYRILTRHRTPKSYFRLDVRLRDPEGVARMMDEKKRKKIRSGKKAQKAPAAVVDKSLWNGENDPTGRGQASFVPLLPPTSTTDPLPPPTSAADPLPPAAPAKPAPPPPAPVIRELRIDINTLHHSTLYSLEALRRREMGEEQLEVGYYEYLERRSLVPLPVVEEPVVVGGRKKGKQRKVEGAVVQVEDGIREGDLEAGDEVEELYDDEEEPQEEPQLEQLDEEASDYESARKRPRLAPRRTKIGTDDIVKRGRGRPKKMRDGEGKPGSVRPAQGTKEGTQRESEVQEVDDDHAMDDVPWYPGDDNDDGARTRTGYGAPLEAPTPRPEEWDYDGGEELDWDELEGVTLGELMGKDGAGEVQKQAQPKEKSNGKGLVQQTFPAPFGSRSTMSAGGAMDVDTPRVKKSPSESSTLPQIRASSNSVVSRAPNPRTMARKTKPEPSTLQTILSRRPRAVSGSAQAQIVPSPATQKKSVSFAAPTRRSATPEVMQIYGDADDDEPVDSSELGSAKGGGAGARGTGSVIKGWVSENPSNGSTTGRRQRLVLSDSEEEEEEQEQRRGGRGKGNAVNGVKRWRLVVEVEVPRFKKSQLANYGKPVGFEQQKKRSHHKKPPAAEFEQPAFPPPLGAKGHKAINARSVTKSATNGKPPVKVPQKRVRQVFSKANIDKGKGKSTSVPIELSDDSEDPESEDGHISLRHYANRNGKGKGREPEAPGAGTSEIEGSVESDLEADWGFLK